MFHPGRDGPPRVRRRMIRLRLFHRQEPGHQIDSRVLDEGEISIGRGVKADWQVSDPERDMSRLHLTIAVRGGMLTVRDTSANGVFIGNPRTRLEPDRPIPVSRGESIVFGPYLIVAEEDAAAMAAPEPPILADDPFTSSRDSADEPAPRPRDPFGSALRPDPVKLDDSPGDGVDAWERRQEFKAGDWDPVAPHRRPDHSQLIGTAQDWSEPPAAPAREHGLGFDAPFTSPILREPAPPSPDAVTIPSDWDAALAAAPPAPEPRVVAPEPPPAPILPPPAAPVAEDPILPPPPAPIPVPAPAQPPIIPPQPPIIPAPDAQAAPHRETAPRPMADDGGGLFESFCAGARLSPDAFAGEDRAALMERLGAVYRQAILGVADLMSERTALKNDFRMVRTTIRPEGNNPFKWVPPQRIAVELLRSEDGSGYSTGERALAEALHDVKAHMLCVLAGMRGAIGATFDLLSPSEIEARSAGRGFLMPGQRAAAAWSDYMEQFATQRREADDSVDGPINRAFRDAYEDQVRQIDGRGPAR